MNNAKSKQEESTAKQEEATEQMWNQANINPPNTQNNNHGLEIEHWLCCIDILM